MTTPDDSPQVSPIAETNFTSEVEDIARFYGGRIRPSWQEALDNLTTVIKEDNA